MPKLPQILAVPEKAPLYGSSRLGSRKERVCMTCTTATLPAELQGVSYVIRGEKSYELSNHLGNVLAVVSDRREAGSCTDSLVDFYYADGRSVSDYYPFGMAMDSRTQSAGGYRWGGQGQEKDDELKGKGNSISYKYRIHDPRIARFFTTDPMYKTYPYWSPYAFSGNRLIDSREQEGLQSERVTETAEDNVGTPYEFGGKGPAFKNGLPESMSEEWYLKNVGYPSSAIKSKGGYGSRYKNPNYRNEINLNQYLTEGANSCGIDCSGLSGTAFNADQDKLMPNFNLFNQNASAQRQSFINAENDNTGFLAIDFNLVGQGDLVFNSSPTHVMIATGQVRTQNGKTEIQVIQAPETGAFVRTEWKVVGSNWTYGRTFRTTDNLLPTYNFEVESPKPESQEH